MSVWGGRKKGKRVEIKLAFPQIEPGSSGGIDCVFPPERVILFMECK